MTVLIKQRQSLFLLFVQFGLPPIIDEHNVPTGKYVSNYLTVESGLIHFSCVHILQRILNSALNFENFVYYKHGKH
jgi:hypothetical protein